MIYFAQTNDNQYIKIGYAKDVRRRLKELQTGAPLGIKLIASMPGTQTVERALHERFRTTRTHGEWFTTTLQLIEFAVRGSMLAGMQDHDPFIYYSVLEPRLIELYVRAAAIVDDQTAPGFCANAAFFNYSDPRTSIKRAIVQLVGWFADPFVHHDLRTEQAYNAVYDRIYDALPHCRNCGCA